jgi:hypothetical protein
MLIIHTYSVPCAILMPRLSNDLLLIFIYYCLLERSLDHLGQVIIVQINVQIIFKIIFERLVSCPVVVARFNCTYLSKAMIAG